MSFSATHLRVFESILRKFGIVSPTLPLLKNQPTYFDIYVIDMQMGFMSDGECGVLDSEHLPQQITCYLDYMIWITKELNANGFSILLRFIFSRDYHHPDHHSFQSVDSPTGFPAHCQYGTNSSMLHPKIIEWIHSNYTENIIITFKGYHPHIESYSALSYTKYYDAFQRQGACCNSHQKEVESNNPLACGGGVVFPKMSLDILLKPNPFSDIDILIDNDTNKDIISDNAIKTLKYMIAHGVPLTQTFKEGLCHSFVVGLAGDFCVRDTLINIINQKSLYGQSGSSCLIYNLTAYVVLPIGNHESDSPMFDTGEHVGEPEEGTDYFIWVSKINDLVLDYVEPSRHVCIESPIFIKYTNKTHFPIEYFGSKIGHL